MLAIINTPTMPECYVTSGRLHDAVALRCWGNATAFTFITLQHPRNYPSELCRYLSSESLRDRSASSCKCFAPVMSPSKCWKSITLPVFQERSQVSEWDYETLWSWIVSSRKFVFEETQSLPRVETAVSSRKCLDIIGLFWPLKHQLLAVSHVSWWFSRLSHVSVVTSWHSAYKMLAKCVCVLSLRTLGHILYLRNCFGRCRISLGCRVQSPTNALLLI